MKSQSKNTAVPDNAKTPQVFPPTNGAAVAFGKVNGHSPLELPDANAEDGYIKRNKLKMPVLANACRCLREGWPGVLAFNTFRLVVTTVKSPPVRDWEKRGGSKPGEMWNDNDDRLANVWLQEQAVLVGKAIANEAVLTVAHEQRFHPVADYLNGLKWDGSPRLRFWLTTYFNAPLNDYTTEVGRCWMISAVARILNPGCKADYCLVLEGKQGHNKSQACKALAIQPTWFVDHLGKDLDAQTAEERLRGKWIVELGEVDKLLVPQRIGAFKGFLSRQMDCYRAPYDRVANDWPRQCVFIGTTNQETDYAHDETGFRRAHPVRCGVVDIEELTKDRDQLWAEARVAYEQGERWWPDLKTTQLAETEQSNRYEHDVWQEPIEKWIANPTPRYEPGQQGRPPKLESKSGCIALLELMMHGLPDKPQLSPENQKRAVRVLTVLKWHRKQIPDGKGKRPWRYIPVEQEPSEEA